MSYYQKCPYCEGVAWRWKIKPIPCETIFAEMVDQDGVTPKNSDICVCQSCKMDYPKSCFNENYLVEERQERTK